MADELNPTVIKATQSSLGKFVKRPPLTEKLLGRPPFKYLHDIFSSVIKSTGFMEGLFTGPEMNPDSFKDRDTKIAYLDKVIRMVGLVNGKEVAVKPSAIVAGKEADKTNLFLQDLASALGKKINNSEYVKRVLNGEGPAAAGAKKQPREDSKERRKDDQKDGRETGGKDRRREEGDDGSRDRKRDRDESAKERSRDREKDKDGDKDKDSRGKEKDRGRSDKDGDKDKDSRGKEKDKGRSDKDGDKDKDSKGKEKDRGRSDKDDDKDRRRSRGDDKKSRTSEAQGSANEGGDAGSGQRAASRDDEGSPNRIPRPSSAKGNRRLRDGRRAPSSADPEEELQRKQKGDAEESAGGGRTYSAKPAPLLKSKAATGVVDDGSGKRVSGVIIERDQDSDDDQFVVEEAPQTLLAGGFGDGGGGGGLGDDDDEEGRDEQHGGLVKEMLKSKQEFKEAGGGKEAGRTVLTTTDANRKREKAATAREIDRLKQQLQALTREANPLGKVIDYVQEDLDSMSKELERWRAETKEVMARLKQEQSTADASLNGLRHQLTELEQAERDKLDLIATVKANIVRNDERISKMIEALSRS